MEITNSALRNTLYISSIEAQEIITCFNAMANIFDQIISFQQRKTLQPQLNLTIIITGKYYAQKCDLILEVLMCKELLTS